MDTVSEKYKQEKYKGKFLYIVNLEDQRSIDELDSIFPRGCK